MSVLIWFVPVSYGKIGNLSHSIDDRSNLGIDIGSWTQVKMERENHNKEEKTLSQESPKLV